MATIKRFEELEIWQLVRKQCIEVEKLVQEGLGIKNARLKDQIQGSSGSVMDNIAEGFEKENTKEFINYLYHSKGSNGEVRSQLIRIMDFNYFENKRIQELISESETISKKIKSFILYLKSIQHKGFIYAEEPEIKYGFSVEDFELFNNSAEPQTSNVTLSLSKRQTSNKALIEP